MTTFPLCPPCPNCDSDNVALTVKKTADMPHPRDGSPQWLAELRCQKCGRSVSVCSPHIDEAIATTRNDFCSTHREDPR